MNTRWQKINIVEKHWQISIKCIVLFCYETNRFLENLIIIYKYAQLYFELKFYKSNINIKKVKV